MSDLSSLASKLAALGFHIDAAGNIHVREGHGEGGRGRAISHDAALRHDGEGHLYLEGHAQPLNEQPVFTVTVGPVPVLAPVKDFGPWMDPKFWPGFVTGVQIEVLERNVTPHGWIGKVLEILGFTRVGGAPEVAELRTELAIDFEHDAYHSHVDFSMVKSEDGVLLMDEGYIRAWPFAFGKMTLLYAKKTIQLSPDAPQNKLAPIIPVLIGCILEIWLWEYSIRYWLRFVERRRSATLRWLLAGPVVAFVFEQVIRARLGRHASVFSRAEGVR